MNKIMNFLMLSCKKATALIVKREDFNLRRIEKMQLFFHTLMCSGCRNFELQNKMISKILKHHISAPEKVLNEEKSPEQLKDSIFSKLEEMK